MIDKDILDFIGLLEGLAGEGGQIPGLDDELAALEAESIGWAPLGSGAYLHLGTELLANEPIIIEVVGSIAADMLGSNILLLT